jgi:hypothetical protein
VRLSIVRILRAKQTRVLRGQFVFGDLQWHFSNFRVSGNQINANVYLGESSAPDVEAEILDRSGTYGRQLGQASHAVTVLLKHLPNRAKLPADERKAIAAFEAMAHEIADIKEKHKRQALRP